MADRRIASSTSTSTTRSRRPRPGSASADDARVALVLPFGSRLATSRINFRLLAREALSHGKRLDIVAPDASARALAASAGLPVFASVGEYEAALDADDDAAERRGRAGDRGRRDRRGRWLAAGAIGAAALGGPAGPGGVIPRPGRRPAESTRRATPSPRQRQRVPITEPASSDYGAPPASRTRRGRRPSAGRRRRRGRRRGPGRRALGVLLVLLLLLGAGAVFAVTILPAADISVTPHIETIGPIAFAVDRGPRPRRPWTPRPASIPATTLRSRVTAARASSRRPARRSSGRRRRARVRFTNCDPSSAYRIPSGIDRPHRGAASRSRSTRRCSCRSPGSPARRAPTSASAARRARSRSRPTRPARTATSAPARSASCRPATTATSSGSRTRRRRPAARARSSRGSARRTSTPRSRSSTSDARRRSSRSELENPATVPGGHDRVPRDGRARATRRPTWTRTTLVGKEVATFTLALTGDRDGPGRRFDADRGDRRGSGSQASITRRLRARAGLDQRRRRGGERRQRRRSRSRSTGRRSRSSRSMPRRSSRWSSGCRRPRPRRSSRRTARS